ncbi:histidine kinase [Escherichia coli]|uniref:histidine kinase n=16 Tax=Enterobacterales TaxID=91347 RepID=UPI000A84EE9F
MTWLFCDRIATKIDKNNGISMITHNFNTLDLLTSPVWIVSPFEEQLIYANSAARLLMQDLTFSQLRTGPYSVSSQKELPKYLSDLQNQHDIIEILTVQRNEEETALSCRLVLRKLTEAEPGNDSNLLIVFYVQIMPDDLVMQLHRF